MEKKDISIRCPQCSGTGIEHVDTIVGGVVQHDDVTCRRCGGDCRVSSLSLNDDLIDMLNDLKLKIDYLYEREI